MTISTPSEVSVPQSLVLRPDTNPGASEFVPAGSVVSINLRNLSPCTDTLAPGEVATNNVDRLSAEIVVETPEVKGTLMGRVRQSLHAGVVAARWSVLLAEAVPPISGTLRYGALGVSELYTHNPAVGAVVLGGSTLLMEVAAVEASLKWIAEGRFNPMIEYGRTKIDQFKQRLNELLPKLKPGRFIPNFSEPAEEPLPDGPLSLAKDTYIGLFTGTPVILGNKQAANPNRTVAQNRRRGYAVLAGVSAYLAGQGAAINLGVEAAQQYSEVSTGVGAFAVAAYLGRKAYNYKHEKSAIAAAERVKALSGGYSAVDPNYFLGQAELDRLKTEMLQFVEAGQEKEGVHALVIDSNHPFSNFIRTHEEHRWEVAARELNADEEARTTQLALVDTRKSSRTYGEVLYTATLSSADKGNENVTGVVAVDELLKYDNGVTADDIRDYWTEQGVDPRRVIGIETSLKLHAGASKQNFLHTVQTAYMAMFKIAQSMSGGSGDKSLGFAAIGRANAATMNSISAFGVRAGLFMGRNDWRTPETEDGDAEGYAPIMISADNNFKLRLLDRLAPQIHYARMGEKK